MTLVSEDVLRLAENQKRSSYPSGLQTRGSKFWYGSITNAIFGGSCLGVRFFTK